MVEASMYDVGVINNVGEKVFFVALDVSFRLAGKTHRKCYCRCMETPLLDQNATDEIVRFFKTQGQRRQNLVNEEAASSQEDLEIKRWHYFISPNLGGALEFRVVTHRNQPVVICYHWRRQGRREVCAPPSLTYFFDEEAHPFNYRWARENRRNNSEKRK